MGLMAKEMRYMHNWGEVAPALVIPHEKPSNNVSKLETIAEEGSEYQSFEILPKRVVLNLEKLYYLTEIMMVKEVSYMHNWGEVAPTLFISHQKSSKCPELETIVEEAGPVGSQINVEILPFSKRALFLVPVIVSCVSYFLLYRYDV
ncbi:hypothetical protein C1H46_031941 [Malus baccata]|uniref:Uncharacterized protein n=1 Tax=Malus baccata TaxID=106549 RepID=A0A540L7N8_MALBA|nr:hypothetical protein C1H46_031941 [Malus baccata]